MQREMCDPSEALPVIVEEFILPMLRETEAIIAQLAPGLDAQQIERCAFSIMGQALFYRFTMPATLRIWGHAPVPARSCRHAGRAHHRVLAGRPGARAQPSASGRHGDNRMPRKLLIPVVILAVVASGHLVLAAARPHLSTTPASSKARSA